MATPGTAKAVDCTRSFDFSNLTGKTAVVTGGANGLGEAYVRALVSANAYFVHCDVTNWEDQVRLFNETAKLSPQGCVDFVVANAGISAEDNVFSYDSEGPLEPQLNMLNVNLCGTLYTTKLAIHYFIKQNGTSPTSKQQDTCLVLISSGAGYFDVPRTPQYCASKWAVRGIMHALRRTAYYYGSRVNIIAPWYVKTKILSVSTFQKVMQSGVELATLEDAGECLLKILSDRSTNGRGFFIAPRKWATRGYMDMALDDYHGNVLLDEIQSDQIVSSPVDAGLLLN